MSSLSKTISLVAAAAAVAGGPTTAAAQAQAQAQRRGRHASESFLLHHHQTDDRALRSDGDATAAIDAVPEVASIVNGTATGGPRSYMVGLTRVEFGLPNANYPAYFTNCGGTLIGPTTVLTAANCMFLPPGNGSFYPVDQVLVNLYDKNDPAGVVAINIQDPSEGADIVVHQDYNPDTFENDIALMFLPIGQVADYAQINDDPKEPVVPDPLRVMGWGLTEEGGALSDVLLETTVNYISNQECKELYAYQIENEGAVITDGDMCAYKKYSGACDGDSGGPLFIVDEDGEIGDHPTQVGIVSRSDDPCSAYPYVYTRVSYYSDWIKETVCSRPEHATKELCGSSKSGKSTKSSSYTP
jgi:secreted trypsin-like serine protease